MSDLIVVGRLAGAFGVRGEVRLKSFCAEAEAIAGYGPLRAPDGRVFRAIRITGAGGGSLGTGSDKQAAAPPSRRIDKTRARVSRMALARSRGHAMNGAASSRGWWPHWAAGHRIEGRDWLERISTDHIIVEDSFSEVEKKAEKEEVEQEALTKEHNTDVFNIVF